MRDLPYGVLRRDLLHWTHTTNMTTVFLCSPSSGAGLNILAKRKVSSKEINADGSTPAINVPAKFHGQIEGYYWKHAIRTWRKEAVKPQRITYDGGKYVVVFAE